PAGPQLAVLVGDGDGARGGGVAAAAAAAGTGTGAAGGRQQAGREEDSGGSQASHSGSPSLSEVTGRMMAALPAPSARVPSTASAPAPMSGASEGNRAATSSGGNGTPALRASCRAGRSRSQDRTMPPPTAIRTGFRQIARLTTW